jgi:hypothetical protein
VERSIFLRGFASELILGTVMCDAGCGSSDDDDGLESWTEAMAAPRGLAEGSFGVGVHRSGFATWASRVSKGKKSTFGRPRRRRKGFASDHLGSSLLAASYLARLVRPSVFAKAPHWCTATENRKERRGRRELTSSQVSYAGNLEESVELLDGACIPVLGRVAEMMAEIQRRLQWLLSRLLSLL